MGNQFERQLSKVWKYLPKMQKNVAWQEQVGHWCYWQVFDRNLPVVTCIYLKIPNVLQWLSCFPRFQWPLWQTFILNPSSWTKSGSNSNYTRLSLFCHTRLVRIKPTKGINIVKTGVSTPREKSAFPLLKWSSVGNENISFSKTKIFISTFQVSQAPIFKNYLWYFNVQ